jgi:glycosyltransferase involved in cell wall biosynthesis
MKVVAEQGPKKRPGFTDRSGVAAKNPSALGIIRVGLLTGCDDKTYAYGLTDALVEKGVAIDFVGSDSLDSPHLHTNSLIHFLNLRGDQNEKAGAFKKVVRVAQYYARLLTYACAPRPRLFHILWHNKFELIDRTILLVYYKLTGKKIVFTAHNVNARERDSKDSWLNRRTLSFQYRMVDHIFVHTNQMKNQLLNAFSVPSEKVTVIPFGINSVYPSTVITARAAKERLGLRETERTVLFFGQIAPYKGLEYLVSAITRLKDAEPIRLIIAGKVKPGFKEYWSRIEREIALSPVRDRIIQKIHFIPDEDVEVYFKAADVLVLPYTHIFQSGLPFLAYNFGLPVIASDVGELRDDVLEGRTGFIFRPRDPADLAEKIESYFSSDLYSGLEARRQEIRDFATERYSWAKVGEATTAVYQTLLAR